MFLISTFLVMAVSVPSQHVQAWITADDGEPAYATVTWDRLPTETEVRRLLPQGKAGTGYAHFRCDQITRDGRLANCKTERHDVNLTSPLDPDYERAGLSVSQYFRVDSKLARNWQGRRYSVVVNVAFVNGAGVRVWGSCYPFCQNGLPRSPAFPRQ